MKKKFWKFQGNELKYTNQIIRYGLKSKFVSFNKRLEQAWSKYHNIKYSITTNSCTSALHAAFLAIGIKKNDEVLVPNLTPIMCGTTINLAGGTPVYVDVNKETFLLDLNDLKNKITNKTKAVLAVHMYSGVCDLKSLDSICKKNKIYLIEDCAEAVGAIDKNGILVGTKGDISCWSFQSAKQLTSGDGGMIGTNNKSLGLKLRKKSNLGFKALSADGDNISIKKDERQNPKYKRFDQIGFNYRMSEFSAAIALAQFERIKYFINLRRKMGKTYEDIFKHNKYFQYQSTKNSFSTYYTFGAFLRNDIKIKWENFRKKFIQNGGDPIYAASKLITQEPAIRNNLIGHCFKNCKKNCVKNCRGTPNAKFLQKRLLLFTTNQKNDKEVQNQKNAIIKTIKYFNLDNKIFFGIFQGRLTSTSDKILQKFPKKWEDEFETLKKLNYDYIELFLEEKINSKNPFWLEKNRVKIRKKIKDLNHKKIIICDNYCLNKSFSEKKTLEYLIKVLKILSTFKQKKLIIPLNDSINFSNKKNDNKKIMNNIIKVVNYAKKFNIELSFETELFPRHLVNYINKKKKNQKLGITFDVGNIYIKNSNINSIFNKYKKIINHIHLKDRNTKGKNTVLGEGLINFNSFFKLLRKVNYSGEITLETHRGKNAIKTAAKNRELLTEYI
jgi:perosamine synthetase